MEPKIIFEDESIIVIDKPAGMIVNRADTTRAYLTVQEWVEKKIGKALAVENKEEESEFQNRGGIVHRLDKETSGILIIAKDEESFKKLQAQFKSREVKKTYIALVHGNLTPEEGEINVPIGRLPWNRTKFGYLEEGGREARTLYKKIGTKKLLREKTEEEVSLVEVYPQTGRTHQIRVHMRYHKFPIFSDELYAGRKMMKKDRKLLSRHFLHANKITFTHPKSGEELTLEAKLPADLQDFWDNLQS